MKQKAKMFSKRGLKCGELRQRKTVSALDHCWKDHLKGQPEPIKP